MAPARLHLGSHCRGPPDLSGRTLADGFSERFGTRGPADVWDRTPASDWGCVTSRQL